MAPKMPPAHPHRNVAVVVLQHCLYTRENVCLASFVNSKPIKNIITLKAYIYILLYVTTKMTSSY